MFIRGSGAGVEHSRVDFAFYRGIVVKTNDPTHMNRVKVFIPEIHNQPYENWIDTYETFNLNGIGSNISATGFRDKSMFEEIANLVPWAEPCIPLMGEGGNFRYYKDGDISTISDCNYPEGFDVNYEDTPTLEKGSFSPAFLYENVDTVIGDAFGKPLDNFSVKCNPYSFSYRPSKHVNKTKGVCGTPEVGSKVWVFHYGGDLDWPIYFGGVMKSQRESLLIMDADNKSKIGPMDLHNFDS